MPAYCNFHEMEMFYSIQVALLKILILEICIDSFSVAAMKVDRL
jgi:hypothetical protein